MSNWIDDQDVAAPAVNPTSLRQRIGDVAASVAATEDWVADTLDRFARTRPHDAARLRAQATHARQFAALERARAARYRSGRVEIRPR